MSSSKGFVAGLLAGALACSLVLFVPVVLVDPTTYIGSRWTSKPQLCARGIRAEPRIGKPLALAAVRPQEVLIGNSRVAEGFSERATTSQIPGSVMNLGIPGASFDELEILFDEALQSGRLRRIWLGLDYGMFERGKKQFLQPMSPSFLARLNAAITNPDAIGMSYATLVGDSCKLAPVSMKGFTDSAQYTEPVDDGWERAVARSTIKMERAFAAIAATDSRQRTALQHSRREALGRMLNRAQKASVAVVLFVGPMSREHFEAIQHAGLEAEFRRWRSEIQAFGAQWHTPVFDFSDYRVTRMANLTACNPARNASCSMYDVSHYQPAVGAHMLSVMRQSLDATGFQLSALQ